MGGTKVKPVTFFSETITTIVLTFICTMGTFFTKCGLIFHKCCSISNTFFSLLRAKLFAGSLNLFVEALHGLYPEFFSPLLNRRTQSPTELTSVASSPYTFLRRLWISIGIELSAVRNSTNSLYLVRTVLPQHPPFCTPTVLNARDLLNHWLSWWRWKLLLSGG